MSSFAEFDPLASTPVFAALDLLDGGIDPAIAIGGIALGAYVTFSSLHNEEPSREDVYARTVMSAFVAGMFGYMLTVSMRSFDAAHWLSSFSGPLLFLHVPFFVTLLSLAIQARYSPTRRPWRRCIAVAAGAGFVLTWLLLWVLSNSWLSYAEWFATALLIVCVLGIGRLTRWIVRRRYPGKRVERGADDGRDATGKWECSMKWEFSEDLVSSDDQDRTEYRECSGKWRGSGTLPDAGTRSGGEPRGGFAGIVGGQAREGVSEKAAVVVLAAKRAAIAFVFAEVLLRGLACLLVNAPGILPTELQASGEGDEVKVVYSNIMLLDEHVDYLRDREVYARMTHRYDLSGTLVGSSGKDSDGDSYLFSSSDVDSLERQVEMFDELSSDRIVKSVRYLEDGEVKTMLQLSEDSEWGVWCVSEYDWVGDKRRNSYNTYYDAKLKPVHKCTNHFDEGTGLLTETIVYNADGTVDNRWVYRNNQYGDVEVKEYYDGAAAEPAYRYNPIPGSGEFVTLDKDGNPLT